MRNLLRNTTFRLFLALIAVWGVYFAVENNVQKEWQKCLQIGECTTPKNVYEAAEQYVRIRGGKLFSAQQQNRIHGPNWYLEANWSDIVCTNEHPVNFPPVSGELKLYVDGKQVGETVTTDTITWYYSSGKYEAIDNQNGFKLEWSVFVTEHTHECFKQTPYLTLLPTR